MTENEKFIKKRIENIVNALQSAQSGKEVFTALCEVPTDNLNDMHDMIAYILGQRSLIEGKKS